MTTFEIALAVLLVWSIGVSVCLYVFGDERYTPAELVALTGWFAFVPVALTIRTYRRWRVTCRVCKLRWADRDALLHHLEKYPNGTCPTD